ncbi:hypothetical protein FHR92_002982 [Fontibacillus solani]|uniref:Uncharacterized protein n=1 Tax=Fontibacillus solani TaxID=1572857 RepID=A0A7W3SUS5_9BACL|nr:hypothetical protein [Fontibacillus solani]MBA9086504.1 hypothetical protein [Fontibacillus solani]
MNLTVVIIGLVLLFLYKRGSGESSVKMPSWIFTAVGIFLLIMLLRNLTDAYQLIFHESDAWWPLIKENARNLSEGLRELLRKMMKG